MLSVASSLGAMNIVLVVICSLIASSLAYRLWHNEVKIPAMDHTIGLLLFAGGWALHRAYWSVNRALEAGGYDFLLTSVYKSYAWITLIPMTAIVVGGGYLLAPVLESFYGPKWFPRYLVTAFVGWLLAAVML